MKKTEVILSKFCTSQILVLISNYSEKSAQLHYKLNNIPKIDITANKFQTLFKEELSIKKICTLKIPFKLTIK